MSWCAGFGGSFYNAYFEVALFGFPETHESANMITTDHVWACWLWLYQDLELHVSTFCDAYISQVLVLCLLGDA